MFDWVADLIGVDKDSPLRTIIGVATMGVIGYGVYYGVKKLREGATSSPSSSRSPASSSSGGYQVGTSNGMAVYETGNRIVRADGVRMKYQNGQYVPYDEEGQKAAAGFQVDCAFTAHNQTEYEECRNEQTTSHLAKTTGIDTYQEAFDSFQRSKANGTLQTFDMNTNGWTKKYITEDGTVLFKDAKGNIATKNAAGEWVVTNSSGQYVKTVASTKSTTQNVGVSLL